MSDARAISRTWWWLAPVLALVLFFVYHAAKVRFKNDLAALEQQSYFPVKADSRSSTGYQWGQRSQILSPDGCHWVMQTQSMLADGSWRVRDVSYDNYPNGREVHWSSSLHWWLGGLAWLWSSVSGVPLLLAVEEVAPFASPLLLLWAMAALVPLVWRWLGRVAAGLLSLAMVLVAPFSEMFDLGDPDHHGMVAVCCMFTVLLLIVGGGGWISSEGVEGVEGVEGDRSGLKEKRFFVASGVAGGIGLWISAATQVPVLVGIGLGVLAAGWWFCREQGGQKKRSGRFMPELWRWWGGAGAGTSVFFYLLEYFPFHLGFRLEVNHPFYAIAWLGGGELLFRLSRWLAGGGFAKPGRDQVLAIGAVFGVLLLPAAVKLASEHTFWVIDRVHWALGRDYVVEGSSVFRRLGHVESARWLNEFNPFPVLVILLGWRVLRSGLAGPMKARLLIGIVPALLVFTLSLMQVRWMGTSCALWLVVFVAVVWLLKTERLAAVFSRGWQIGLALLAFLAVAPWTIQTVNAGASVLRSEKGFSQMSLRRAVVRDLARWLRMRVGSGREVVVLGGPSVTTELVYHGGFKGLGSLYWENKDGLGAMVDIYGTSNDLVAWELIKKHGITHLVVVSWDAFAEEAARIAAGLRRFEKAPQDTFQARLSKGHGCPFWLRPVYYPAPEMGALKDDFILVYEVVPEMSREEAALRFAQLMADRGSQQEAANFMGVLVRRYPEYLPGWIALAQLQAGLKDEVAFRVSFGRIATLQARAGELALDDRIGLATVLAATGDVAGAHVQVRACLESADEAALRRLSSSQLLALALLAQDAGEGASRTELMRQLTELIPGEMRKQVQAVLDGR